MPVSVGLSFFRANHLERRAFSVLKDCLETKAWRNNAKMVGCRLRSGADLRLHLADRSAVTDLLYKFAGGNSKDEV